MINTINASDLPGMFERFGPNAATPIPPKAADVIPLMIKYIYQWAEDNKHTIKNIISFVNGGIDFVIVYE